MSDTPPVPPTPATPPPAGTPAAAGPKQTMSIIGFVLGLASVVILSWTGLIGVAAGVAAIIVSNKAKKSEPGAPSWMHTVGVITGIVGIVLGIIFGLVILASFLLPLILVGTTGIPSY
jgi:uncharacterized membrane protein HdeD (DUF308 family)